MMSIRWVAGVFVAGVGIAGLVAAPSMASAAKNTKPAEIVVVGSKIKIKKKSGGKAGAGDTLIHRWQRTSPRPKGLKSR